MKKFMEKDAIIRDLQNQLQVKYIKCHAFLKKKLSHFSKAFFISQSVSLNSLSSLTDSSYFTQNLVMLGLSYRFKTN